MNSCRYKGVEALFNIVLYYTYYSILINFKKFYLKKLNIIFNIFCVPSVDCAETATWVTKSKTCITKKYLMKNIIMLVWKSTFRSYKIIFRLILKFRGRSSARYVRENWTTGYNAERASVARNAHVIVYKTFILLDVLVDWLLYF